MDQDEEVLGEVRGRGRREDEVQEEMAIGWFVGLGFFALG